MPVSSIGYILRPDCAPRFIISVMPEVDPLLEIEVGVIAQPGEVIRPTDKQTVRHFDFAKQDQTSAIEYSIIVRHPAAKPVLYGFDRDSYISPFVFELCTEIYVHDPALPRILRPKPDCTIMMHYWQNSPNTGPQTRLYNDSIQYFDASDEELPSIAGQIGIWVWNESSYQKTFNFIDVVRPGPAVTYHLAPDARRALGLAKAANGFGQMQYNSDFQPAWTRSSWLKEGDVVALY